MFPTLSVLKRLSLLLTLAVATPLALAAEQIPRWYRYLNDKNQPTVTDSITAEHVARGYDELTEGMRLIRHVPPQRAMTAEEHAAAKAKKAEDEKRVRDDKQIQRLYSRPQDAELARNRQVDALQVRIDFAESQITRLRQSRAGETQKAAAFERKGKPVPKDLKDSIGRYDKQLQAAQTEVDTRKTEQAKVMADFEPVIKRLEELTGQKASGVQPASLTKAAAKATSASPATPATPGAGPATPATPAAPAKPAAAKP